MFSILLGGKKNTVERIFKGIIGTPFGVNSGIPKEFIEQFWERLTKEQPTGRIGNAQDVASLVTFIASSEADFMSGSSVVTDGAISCKSFLQ